MNWTTGKHFAALLTLCSCLTGCNPAEPGFTCRSIYEPLVRYDAQKDSQGGNVVYVFQDENGISQTVNSSNSDEWRCAPVAGE